MNKNLKKILILVIILGAIIALVAAFFVLNSTPDSFSEEEKEKAVAQILGRKPNLNPEVKTGSVVFTGKNISFSYPARAVIYEPENKGKVNASTLESFSFDIENPRLILNYTASNKPDLRSVLDDPAVKLREDLSRGYTSEDIEVEGVSGKSYKKEAGGGERAEHTAFIIKDGVLFTISITGVTLKDVDNLFKEIISSVSFQ